jgi:nucleoside permease NupC
VSDLRGLLGLAAILAVAFLFSNNRGRAGSFEAGV